MKQGSLEWGALIERIAISSDQFALHKSFTRFPNGN